MEGVGLHVVADGNPWYDRVKGLEAGQTSGIFQQDGKYHIIKVVEHDLPSDRPPLETVRDKLQREIFLRKAMDRIRRAADQAAGGVHPSPSTSSRPPCK